MQLSTFVFKDLKFLRSQNWNVTWEMFLNALQHAKKGNLTRKILMIIFYRPKWKPVTGDIAEQYSIGQNKNLTQEIFLIIFRQAKMKIILITLCQARIKTGHDNVWKARTESRHGNYFGHFSENKNLTRELIWTIMEYKIRNEILGHIDSLSEPSNLQLRAVLFAGLLWQNVWSSCSIAL